MAHDLTSAWFADRAVLVTGGATGIGAAVARAFATAGAQVTVAGLAPAEIEDLGPGTEFVSLDVRDEQAIQDCVAARAAIDHLVNCAGIIRRTEEFDPAVFAEVVDINLIGTMRMCMAARDLLTVSTGASITNIASMYAIFGGGRQIGYASSKGGVVQLTKSLAIAFAPAGIRVNAVAPGWITTNMTARPHDDPDMHARIVANTPASRWGTAEEAANAIMMLASPLASFITGAILPVDGGYSCAKD